MGTAPKFLIADSNSSRMSFQIPAVIPAVRFAAEDDFACPDAAISRPCKVTSTANDSSSFLSTKSFATRRSTADRASSSTFPPGFGHEPWLCPARHIIQLLLQIFYGRLKAMILFLTMIVGRGGIERRRDRNRMGDRNNSSFFRMFRHVGNSQGKDGIAVGTTFTPGRVARVGDRAEPSILSCEAFPK